MSRLGAGKHAALKAGRRIRQRQGFRGDIQGLRALAVGAVVVYHLWPGQLRGGFAGVDVFFVISGFLITTHLVSSPPRGLGDFGRFWAKRIRRLLPASLLVIVATVVAVWALAPATAWKDTGSQAMSAATYWQNWRLAFSSVDYLAADNAPTALQHFWSLSVEEQFYFVWPLLVAALLAVTGSRRLKRSVLMLGLAVIVVGGLGFSLWYTHENAPMAYFVTTTRIWELAAGGLTAAVVFGRPAGRGILSAFVAWVGLAGIVASVFVLDPAAPFPGWRAVIPVIATALVLGANAQGRFSPNGLLSLAPAQFIGNTSYSIYLWHWPLTILAEYRLGELTWRQKLIIIAMTLVLAWATMELVEQRFRRWTNKFSLTVTFVSTAVIMALVVGLGWGLGKTSDLRADRSQRALAQAEAGGVACFGADALEWLETGEGRCPDQDDLLLDAVTAKSDKTPTYADGCMNNPPFTTRTSCTYGDGKTQVALVGNSHAAHWLPTLQQLAKERDWTITTFVSGRCTVNPATQVFDRPVESQNCLDYGEWVMERTSSGDFDVVVTSERQSVRIEGSTWKQSKVRARAGYVQYLNDWHEAGVPVVVLRDTPSPSEGGIDSVPDCVAEHADDADACNGTAQSWARTDALSEAVKRLDHDDQYFIQTEQWLCPAGTCRSSIGRVITFFDSSHLTATYARTLSPQLGASLDKLKLDGM
ncbi:MAG: acyltransferase family protein [Galactobacter sp.]